MVELASLNCVVDRLVHARCLVNELRLLLRINTNYELRLLDLNKVVGTIMINQQPCSCMRTCCDMQAMIK